MSKNDDILAAPGLSAAVAGGGGTSVSIDTAGIEKGNSEIKGQMASLRKEMEGYFGFGGTTAKQMGKRVGSKFESMRNS